MKARESTRKDCDCGKTNSVLMLKKRGRLEEQDKMNGVCGFLSWNKKIAFKFRRMTPYQFGNHKVAGMHKSLHINHYIRQGLYYPFIYFICL